MKLLIRLLVGAASLGIATWIVNGIEITSDRLTTQIATLVVIALIFGVLNTFLKPIVKILGCALYVLTLGLFAFVVNGLLLWLTSWLAAKWELPFHVDGFLPAVWGALIIGIASWFINLFINDDD